MKTTIQIVLVVVATAFALNAMSQTIGQPWPTDLEESRPQFLDNWKQYSEQELNLRQDTRNMLYAAGAVACAYIMNNNGNDQLAVNIGGTLAFTALTDNVVSIIRRNKKLNRKFK